MDSKEAASAVRQVIGGYSPADPDSMAAALRDVWLQATPTDIDLAKAEQFLGLQTAGTPMPVLKAMGDEIGKVARKQVADFIPLACHLWDGYGREGRILASTFLGPMELVAPKEVIPVIYQLAQTCIAWEDCDQLAMSALEPIVRKDPEGYLDRLAPWVADENKWVRRAAITAIGRLPMKRAGYTARCLELVEPALGDSDLDVKRALSFAIRVSARGQVAPVHDFILAHRDATDPDSIWVLCDVIRSMTKVFLPEFADLLHVYEAWLETADARTRRSVESAIKTLKKAKGMMSLEEQRTLLAVFAHPDDESFGIGGTLARYAAEGVRVALACATLGEAGEVKDPSLGTREQLAEIRERELRCACDVLGISELHLLGYRDSGMAGSPDNDDPRALVQADPAEVVGKIVRVIRQVRPQVVITFEEGGGYGHPDHIAIHRHTVAAFWAAGDPSQYPEHRAEGLEPHVPQKLYFTVLPRRFFLGLAQRLTAMGYDLTSPGDFDWESMGIPDELCTAEIDVSAYVDTKLQAFQCHRSQFSRNGPFDLLPPEVRWEFMSIECFSLAGSRLEAGQMTETDLFASL